MLAVDLLLALLAFFGHMGISVAIFNRLHALGLPCKVVKRSEKIVLLTAAAVLVLFASYWLLTGFAIYERATGAEFWPPLLYLVPCWAAAFCIVPLWAWRRWASRRPAAFVADQTQLADVQAEVAESLVGARSTRMLLRIPGNQIFRLAITEKTFRLPRLPAALDGLTIAHLSDLHMTGQLTRPFFDYVVDRVNALDCDVVALTGDLVEKQPCLEWISPTLGRLSSRCGIYYVLGNHDKRLADIDDLHRRLAELGHTHLGQQALLSSWRETPILLAGNESPWFNPPPDMAEQRPQPSGPFRLLLSHSPDQFYWAQRHAFDLMLAGHTHGGQIRLPLYGPLIAPSRFGVMYASGVFQQGPTLMHVSRGISGLQPIRLNCLPEITKLVLRSEAGD